MTGKDTNVIARLLRAAWPVIVIQLGNQLLGFVDAAIVSRSGEIRFGAVGLGASVFMTITLVGIGLLFGFDPLVSQARGAQEFSLARRLDALASRAAIVIAVPLIGSVFAIGAAFEALGVDTHIATEARAYLAGRAFALLPVLLVIALRIQLQAQGRTRPIAMGALFANLVNAPLASYLVFGDDWIKVLLSFVPGNAAASFAVSHPLGLGTAGAGIAASVAACVQLAFAYVGAQQARREEASRPDGPLAAPEPSTASLTKKAARLGAGSASAILAEASVFLLAGFLAARLGATALAAHNVALLLASMTFQIPLGIGNAASVEVGLAIGAGDTQRARSIGLLAFGLGAAVMLLSGAIMGAFPGLAAGLVTNDTRTLEAAAHVIIVGAFFQLFDGIQAVGGGVMRGIGMTQFSLLANLAGHYLVGLPVSIALAFFFGYGTPGLWWGLTAGLATVAALLLVRFVFATNKAVVRV